MLTKRIIPCLDIKDGRTVKGVNFVGLRDAGDPVDLADLYSKEGADELVFLDITATHEKRKTLHDLVTRVAERINIPFTVGESVKVIDGPFNGFTGSIDVVNEEKRKLEVMVKIFGRKTPLELSYMQVEKL